MCRCNLFSVSRRLEWIYLFFLVALLPVHVSLPPLQLIASVLRPIGNLPWIAGPCSFLTLVAYRDCSVHVVWTLNCLVTYHLSVLDIVVHFPEFKHVLFSVHKTTCVIETWPDISSPCGPLPRFPSPHIVSVFLYYYFLIWWPTNFTRVCTIY